MTLLNVVGWVIAVAATLAVLVHAVRRTRREPRRLSNGVWLLVATLLTIQLAAAIGVPGAGFAQGLLVVLLGSAPLLIGVVAIFLIINGVTMMRKESRSLGNALSLLAGLALVALSVAPLLVLVAQRRGLLIAVAFVSLIAAYVGFVFVSFLFYSWLYPKITSQRPVDWVVVLGSGLVGGDRVPPLLAGRIATGQAEFAKRRATVLIMSGGKGHDERLPEAEAMAAWALEHGADADTLRVENRSATTEQNLRFSTELLAREPVAGSADIQTPSGRVAPSALDRLLGGPIDTSGAQGLVVTSDYHVLRAAILARQLGIAAQATGARTARYYWPSAMLREFVALLANRWRFHAVLGSVVALPIPVLLLILPAIVG